MVTVSLRPQRRPWHWAAGLATAPLEFIAVSSLRTAEARQGNLGPVIKLLEKMQNEAKSESEEKTRYFKDLIATCDADVVEEKRVRDSTKSQMDGLKSSLATFDSRIAAEQENLATLGEEISAQEAEAAKLKHQKDEYERSFAASRTSLTGTLMALEKAGREYGKGNMEKAEKELLQAQEGSGSAVAAKGTARLSSANNRDELLGQMLTEMSGETREKLAKLIAQHKLESGKLEEMGKAARETLRGKQDDKVQKQETVEALKVDAARAAREFAKSKEGLASVEASLKAEKIACEDHKKEAEFVKEGLAKDLQNLGDALESLKGGDSAAEEDGEAASEKSEAEGDDSGASEETKGDESAKADEKELPAKEVFLVGSDEGTAVEAEDADADADAVVVDQEEGGAVAPGANAGQPGDSADSSNYNDAADAAGPPPVSATEGRTTAAAPSEVDVARSSPTSGSGSDDTSMEEVDVDDSSENAESSESGAATKISFPTAFLQVSTSGQLRLRQALVFLSKVSPKLASLVQANVKFGVTTAESPFAKVTDMIKQMVKRLEQEAAEDQSQDEYCKKSVAKAKAKEGRLQSELKKFEGRVKTTEALLEQQNLSVKKTAKDVKLIAEEQKKEEKLRMEGKAENEKIVGEARENEKALGGAIAALSRGAGEAGGEEASSSSAEGTDAAAAEEDGAAEETETEGENDDDSAAPAFLQKRSVSAAPSKTRAAEKANEGASSKTENEIAAGSTSKTDTVLETLRTLRASAEKRAADTESEERVAAAQFVEITNKRKVETASLQKKGEMLELEKQRLKTQLLQQKEDVRLTQDELSAVNEGMENLKEQCTPKTLTPEQKQARREETLESLKEALEILEGE